MKRFFPLSVTLLVLLALAAVLIFKIKQEKMDWVAHTPASTDNRFLQGRALAVNLEGSDAISKKAVLSGNDLILVVLEPPTKNVKNFQIGIRAVANFKDFAALDPNHSGEIDRHELASSNLALLRCTVDGGLRILPLAGSKIEKIKYTPNSKNPQNELL